MNKAIKKKSNRAIHDAKVQLAMRLQSKCSRKLILSSNSKFGEETSETQAPRKQVLSCENTATWSLYIPDKVMGPRIGDRG